MELEHRRKTPAKASTEIRVMTGISSLSAIVFLIEVAIDALTWKGVVALENI